MDFKNQVKLMRSLQGDAPKKSKNSLKNVLFTKKLSDDKVYGIIQENHKYYIMESKGGNEPEQFEHIDGFLNKKKHEYKTYGSASKNLNFMDITIKESVSSVKKSAEMAKGLDDELEKTEKPKPVEPSMDDMPTPTDTTADEMPLPNEAPAEDGATEEMPMDDVGGAPETAEPAESPENFDFDFDVDSPEVKSTIEKGIGKMAYVIRKLSLEPIDTKTYLGTFISAFSDHLKDLDVEDRKTISDKIMKVVEEPAEELQSAQIEAGKDFDEELTETDDSFDKFLESHNIPKKILGKLSSKSVAKVLEAYYKEYKTVDNGQVQSLLLKEGVAEQINEINFKNALKAVGSTLKKGANKAVDAGKKGANKVADAGKAVAKDVKTNYHTNQVGGYIDKIEDISQKLKEVITKMNDSMGKSGNQAVNISSLLTTIKNQLGSKSGGVNLSKFRLNEDNDPANYEVDLENSYTINDDGDEEKPNDVSINVEGSEEGVVDDVDSLDDIDPLIDTDPLVPSPEESSVDDGLKLSIDVSGDNKKVDVNLKEEKIRKYIAHKLNELSGKVKPINEGVEKSAKLKKLDKLIENQYLKYKKGKK